VPYIECKSLFKLNTNSVENNLCLTELRPKLIKCENHFQRNVKHVFKHFSPNYVNNSEFCLDIWCAVKNRNTCAMRTMLNIRHCADYEGAQEINFQYYKSFIDLIFNNYCIEEDKHKYHFNQCSDSFVTDFNQIFMIFIILLLVLIFILYLLIFI